MTKDNRGTILEIPHKCLRFKCKHYTLGREWDSNVIKGKHTIEIKTNAKKS